MSAEPIARVRKNSREEIHVGIQDFRGSQVASVRVWFSAADGSMRPGRDGISFRASILPEIHAAVTLALEEARARGLCE